MVHGVEISLQCVLLIRLLGRYGLLVAAACCLMACEIGFGEGEVLARGAC